MNNFIGIGNMTKDIEIRANEKGDKFGLFNLAIQRDRDREKTDFMRCMAFNKTAELLEQYTKKGSKIAVQGRIQTGDYEKDGIKHFTTTLIVDNMQFLDRKEKEDTEDTIETKKDPYEDFGNNIELENGDMPF